MQAVIDAKDTLTQLFIEVKTFQQATLHRAIYHAPIIDYFHPDNYSQRGIAGLSKFRDSIEAELGFVQGIVDSGIAPKDFTTNTPNLHAIWIAFSRAKWPIVSVGLYVGGASKGQTKIDVVCDGGNEWIKVNTIKTQRLLAEFREQDSYINSDYDSDGPYPDTTRHPTELSSSLVKQARALITAAKSERRPVALPPPQIRLILNRIEEVDSYEDNRIPATFQQIRDLGVDLVLGACYSDLAGSSGAGPIKPSRHILLDLSVVIALCCDSTHHPLPRSTEDLESRFRALARKDDGSYELEPHVNVTKDLRNQLEWEWSHPLVEEIDNKLSEAGYQCEEVHFWVTREVRDRMPAILDVIGGPWERARAEALFGETSDFFWKGSRYENKIRVLEDILVRVLPERKDAEFAIDETTRRTSIFDKGLMSACQLMLDQGANGNEAMGELSTKTSSHRKSRNPKRIETQFPPNTRAPSAHTLRTMIAGFQNGMTVLTNNRGAVGKVVREMGIYGGFPNDEPQPGGNQRRAAVWVVNPSSLCEWRRREVEQWNAEIQPVGHQQNV